MGDVSKEQPTAPFPYTDAEMAQLDTAHIIAWFMHWNSHRRANCQCAAPYDEEIDHGQRAADALKRLGRLRAARSAGDRAPVNPYADDISQRAFSLIFNGLTVALTNQWMPLSERMRISEAIYETLRAGGIEIRLADGLAKLAQVAAELTGQGDG